ncbi:MAG: hypothetical protein R3C28_00315 [Pirellulaceae bacterium]
MAIQSVRASFGRFKQLVSLASTLLGERRIATDNQSLVGKMFRCHRPDPVCRTETSGSCRLHNLRPRYARRKSSQPFDTAQVFVDPSRRDHAAITNENEPVDAETFTSRRDDLSECRRVGRVAREDFNRNRTTFRIAQQTVHDLRAIATMIATVTMFDQRTLSPRVIARRNIEQYQLPVLQVLLGELVFDPR